jgi:micrococcal nuclease
MDFAPSFAFFLVFALAAPPSHAEVLPGPVEARVLRIIDGDTLEAEARIWPGHTIRVGVRIRGIDAPEMRTRCAAEKAAAERARAALERLIGDRPVMVSNIGGGKYYGRVLADVSNAEGRPLAPELLARSLVRPYDGGRRVPFCEVSGGHESRYRTMSASARESAEKARSRR